MDRLATMTGTAKHVHPRWLSVGRAVWIAAAALTLALLVAGLPPFFAALQIPCAGAPCIDVQPTPAFARALEAQGLSLRAYAGYRIACEVVCVLGYGASAALLMLRKPGGRMPLLGAIMLVSLGTTFTASQYTLVASSPAWRWPVAALGFLGSVSLLGFFYLFPDGRFTPRWTRPAAGAWAAVCALGYFTPPDWPINQDPAGGSLFPFFALPFIGGALGAQIYRYRRVSTPAQRQQAKWVVAGFAATFAGLALTGALGRLPSAGTGFGLIAAHLIGNAAFYGALLLLPLSIGVAVLRYRLWDIDVLIGRALVYGCLTAGVVGLYVLVVGYLGALFRTGDNLAISLVATGLVAVVFQPLRERLQRGVNRILYGERDEPYAVLSRLGRRLEETLAPDAVLPTVAATVREALKLPYAAIALRRGGDEVVVAASGVPVADPVRLPLAYGPKPVGAFLIAPRAAGETFSPADRRLLDDLARQAGVAAHAARLTADLQHSRERLVAAREEERRRLRRDLHDGLGPQLASLTLKLDAARNLLARDPAAVDTLLADLKAQAQGAVADIRRVVYDLRPPALDDLGLVSALRESAANYAHDGHATPEGLRIAIDAPDRLPPLPAAVEVAAYRIAQEALTNVVRHAGARRCTVRLALDEPSRVLCLEITDDGRGLPDRAPADRPGAGVGLGSMRERAAELGGDCVIAAVPGGGVRVSARLPYAGREGLQV